MITQQVQIKLNLPFALKEYLDSKASKFDMPTASYLKHLILKDVSDLEYPTFAMSAASERALKKALAQRNKAVHLSTPTEISTYFNNL